MSSRPRTSFVCQSCGNRTPKWVGRCSACDEWGTVVEFISKDQYESRINGIS